MEKPPPEKFNFISLSIFFFCIALFSCAEDKIDAPEAQANIVFDFEDEKNPAQRLSVFVAVVSNVRRVENVSASHGEYFWKIENPVLFQSREKSWAGHMHLSPPPNLEKFPRGEYSFECVDAAGNSAQGNFFVDYDENLFGEFLSENFSGGKWSERIAVYSEIGELLHFDENKKNQSDEKIFHEIKDSKFLRHIYQSQNVICLGPKIFKEGVDENGQ
ncbi:MAG: hypothetical protein HDR35_06445 [Treponema sp.]|nr:hypothetical protein [Treponema sp.]